MRKLLLLAFCLLSGSGFAGPLPITAVITAPHPLNVLAPSLPQGETLSFDIQAAGTGHLTLLLRRPDGRLALLRTMQCVAGKPSAVELVTSALPPGRYQVVGVLSSRPLSFPQAYRAGGQALLSFEIEPRVQPPAILDLRSPLHRPVKGEPRLPDVRPGGGWPLQVP